LDLFFSPYQWLNGHDNPRQPAHPHHPQWHCPWTALPQIVHKLHHLRFADGLPKK